MRSNLCQFAILLLLVSALSFNSVAQDLQFSQTFATPLLVNPALTGAYQGNFRLAAVYRDQWSGLIDDPFRSFSVSGDARILIDNRRTRGDFVGAGVQIMNDRVSTFDFSTTSILFNGAYHKALDKSGQKYLSVGTQFGLAQKNFSYENFKFQDQFDGVNEFPFTTSEGLPVNNFAYFDLGLGGRYVTPIGRRDVQLEVGLAGYHLLEPNISFYQSEDNPDDLIVTDNSLKRRITAHATTGIYLDYGMELTPRIIFTTQGKHQMYTFGTGYRVEVNDVKQVSLHAGLWGRVTHDLGSLTMQDAIAMIGVEYQRVIIGISYDLSIADVTTYNAGQHSFELSIRYIGDYEDDGIFCPQF